MKTLGVAARFALVFSCGLAMAAPVAARHASHRAHGGHVLQCVPYAREMSGIDLRGNANTWWGQAEGRYARGHAPRVGAVLAFAATRHMRLGHVAMVSQVVGDREVLLTHANWSRRGGIERDVRAIDVSPNNDWSEVKVWFAPLGDLGLTAYPTKGFIYRDSPADDAPVVLAASNDKPGHTLDAVMTFTGSGPTN